MRAGVTLTRNAPASSPQSRRSNTPTHRHPDHFRAHRPRRPGIDLAGLCRRGPRIHRGRPRLPSRTTPSPTTGRYPRQRGQPENRPRTGPPRQPHPARRDRSTHPSTTRTARTAARPPKHHRPTHTDRGITRGQPRNPQRQRRTRRRQPQASSPTHRGTRRPHRRASQPAPNDPRDHRSDGNDMTRPLTRHAKRSFRQRLNVGHHIPTAPDPPTAWTRLSLVRRGHNVDTPTNRPRHLSAAAVSTRLEGGGQRLSGARRAAGGPG
jgi:hypothetical protein